VRRILFAPLCALGFTLLDVLFDDGC